MAVYDLVKVETFVSVPETFVSVPNNDADAVVIEDEDPPSEAEADVYYLIIAGVVFVATICLIVAGALWWRSKALANKLISVEGAAGYTKVRNSSEVLHSHSEARVAPRIEARVAPRIVLLYGVDHPLHIRAVSRFAEVLRKLLGVEVVLEREQGREATRNVTSWMTDNLSPPTTVIVITSEGLYQLYASYDYGAGEPSSPLRSDTFAEFGPKSLIYLRNHWVDGVQTVVAVSFGYSHGDISHNKLIQSNPVLSEGAHFTITYKDEFGVRTLDIEGLLLAVRDQAESSGEDGISEIREFLASVDEMDAHINKYGPLCWEHDAVGTMDGVSSSSSSSSSSVRPSSLTVNYSRRKCRETSSYISDTDSLSRLEYTAPEHSCVTLLIPEDVAVKSRITITTPGRNFIEESPSGHQLLETQHGEYDESSSDQMEVRDY